MKDQVLLENYYLPGDLKARLGEFIEYYNTQRYHESLNNLTPEDVYTGRGQTVLNRRMRIKQKTIAERRRPATILNGQACAEVGTAGTTPHEAQFGIRDARTLGEVGLLT